MAEALLTELLGTPQMSDQDLYEQCQGQIVSAIGGMHRLCETYGLPCAATSATFTFFILAM